MDAADVGLRRGDGERGSDASIPALKKGKAYRGGPSAAVHPINCEMRGALAQTWRQAGESRRLRCTPADWRNGTSISSNRQPVPRRAAQVQ